MTERKYLENQIGSLANQQETAKQIFERCEGALQMARARLAFIVQEAEAQAKADAEALKEERGSLQAVLTPSGNGDGEHPENADAA